MPHGTPKKPLSIVTPHKSSAESSSGYKTDTSSSIPDSPDQGTIPSDIDTPLEPTPEGCKKSKIDMKSFEELIFDEIQYLFKDNANDDELVWQRIEKLRELYAKVKEVVALKKDEVVALKDVPTELNQIIDSTSRPAGILDFLNFFKSVTLLDKSNDRLRLIIKSRFTDDNSNELRPSSQMHPGKRA